jgi:hypothetical protein
MDLILADAILAAEKRLEGWIPQQEAYCQDLITDSRFSGNLRAYLLLTEHPEAFSDRYDPESIFWSRYYWFLRLIRVFQECEGADAGMEQQAFQILEHPWPNCDPDWSHLKLVERAATEAAVTDLQALAD